MRKILRPITLVIICLTLIFAASSCDILFPTQCVHDIEAATCTSPARCKKCDEIISEKLEHTVENRTTVPPTCTEQGYDVCVCELCGIEFYDNYTAKAPHNESAWIFDPAPTESTDGERYTECTVCGIIIKPRETVLAHRHSYREEVTAPDCVNEGYTTFACDCGYSYKDEFEAALGHTALSVSAKPATCTVDGYFAYEYCTACDYTTYRKENARGHSWSSPAPVGDGTHIRVCENDKAHNDIELCYGGSPTAAEAGICIACGGEYRFTAREGNSSYGYFSLADYSNAEELQSLYLDFWMLAEAFMFSDEDVAAEGKYYTIGKVDYSKYSLSSDEAMAVWKVFYIDTPAYYWLSNISTVLGDEILLSIDGDYASAEYRRECDLAIEAMETECAEYISGAETELELAVGIAGYIMSNMEYAYESDGVTPLDEMWAHNIVGLAMYDLGVCETYAKAYLYLTALNGVESIMGSGIGGGEAHAWNYVSVNDVWYGVDITWCDNSGDTPVYDNFGLSELLMNADHTLYPNDLSASVQYHYAIPDISDTSLELAMLYKDGSYIGIYGSIDLAMADIAAASSSYEIRIGLYSGFIKEIEHTMTASAVPSVASLRITGKNIAIGEGYMDYNAPLNIAGDLNVGTVLELADLSVSGEGSILLNTDKSRLVLTGDGVLLEMKVVCRRDTLAGAIVTARYGKLEINSVDTSYIMDVSDINELEIKNGKLCFGADAAIYKVIGAYDGKILVTRSDINITVKTTG